MSLNNHPIYVEIRHGYDESFEYRINDEAVTFFTYDKEKQKGTNIPKEKVIRAIGAHDALVAAVKGTIRTMADTDDDIDMDPLYAALALAEGDTQCTDE